MPDYKEMYLEMFRETEKAINILIAVQQKCEEQYLESTEQEPVVQDRCSVLKNEENTAETGEQQES